MDYSGAAAKAEMMKITRASCASIKATKASPEAKLKVAMVSVTKMLGYKERSPAFHSRITRT